MKILSLITLSLCLALPVGARRQNIIFETDMGNDIDDALALDMLYKFDTERQVRLLAVMLNKDGDFPLKYIDLMNTWYGHPRLPIGRCAPREKDIQPAPSYTQVVVQERDSLGRPLWERSLKDYSQLLPAPVLYRKLLQKAKNHSVTIVSVGFSTNLAALLDTKPDDISPLSGEELVREKVDRLVVMAGNMQDPTSREFNVVGDIQACQAVFRRWPTRIYVSPFEVGLQILYPARSIETGFGWTPRHPLVDSYKAYLPGMEDRPTWDLTAVLFAVQPEDFFTLSPAGQVTVTDEGHTLFSPQPDGRHFYLSVTPDQARRILDFFVQKTTERVRN